MTEEQTGPTEEAKTYISNSYHPLPPGKKKLIKVSILLIILLGVGWYLNQQGILSKASQTAWNLWQEFRSLDAVTTLTQPPAAIPAQVTITAEGFVPQTILVKKGSTIKWANRDNRPHQVASDPHPTHTMIPTLGKGKLLPTGSSTTLTFDNAGTFTYHDEQDPLKFKGTIIVK